MWRTFTTINAVVMKVLMVCLGNICRSPLAEGILASKAPRSWIVDSAGTSAYHEGERPDTRSILTARNHGLSIDHQRSRPVRVEDFDQFDVLFAMDQSNYNNLIKIAPTVEAAAKVRLLMNESRPELNTPVPDPYTGGQSGFETVYGMIEEAVDAFLAKQI